MKIFSSARFRLTAWYTLSITLISLLFSLGIYRVQATELSRFEELQRARIETRLHSYGPMRGLNPLLIDLELVAEAKERILLRLGIFNGVIIILSSGLGYFLSGKTLRPIEEMVSEQHRFVSDASHELRTPLTAIRTSLEVFLRGKKLSLKSAKALLQDNLVEVERLQHLTDSLLMLSLPAHEQPELEHLDLAKVLRTVAKQLAPIAKSKELKLTTSIGTGHVDGNYPQLVQLFTILLDNAIKYTPRKGNLSLTSTSSGKELTVTLKDSGVGIDRKDLPHIFDRFYRASSARSKNGEGGYGLGLAIAKQIVESHNAKITVSSKPGVGSVFTVILQLA